MTCSTGSKVTLRSVSANPDLAQKLKAFMGGVEFAEGHSYERSLTGTRKDPAACAGFFGAIDLAGCQKYKPAGTSIFKVQNGEIQYLADGRSELVPITLNKICTDGVGKMSFQFHYDQTFLTVRAGPWDYTITVSKKSGRVYSDIKAVVLANGTNVSLNKSPIEVGPVHIRPYGHYPHEMAPQSNATR